MGVLFSIDIITKKIKFNVVGQLIHKKYSSSVLCLLDIFGFACGLKMNSSFSSGKGHCAPVIFMLHI